MRDSRHWVVSQGLLNPTFIPPFTLDDGEGPFYGNTVWLTGLYSTPYPFVVVYLPPPALPSPPMGLVPRRIIIHEVDCQFFGAPYQLSPIINQNGNATTFINGTSMNQTAHSVTNTSATTTVAPGEILFNLTPTVGPNLIASSNVQSTLGALATGGLPVTPVTLTHFGFNITAISGLAGPEATTVATATNVGFTANFDGAYGFFNGLQFSIVVPAIIAVNCCLYVSRYDQVNNAWVVRNPFAVVQDGYYDYEDIVNDVFTMPTQFTGGFSRSWRLKLRTPINLEPGEALIASFMQSSLGPLGLGFSGVVPNLRALITLVD
jgi:hypothetical protein